MKKYKKAFSVGEMMIVLLVLSIILAASMPIITKRSKSSVDRTWQAATNGSDAYFGTGETQGIAIGTTAFPAGNFGKILLNVANAANTTVAHILFSGTEKIANVDVDKVYGHLRVGNAQIDFGSDTVANATNSIAIGFGANATGNESLSLGYGSAAGANSIAIGKGALANTANVTDSLAIGYGANASANGTSALGNGANATGSGASAFGAGSVASTSAAAVGSTASANAANATAVGSTANAGAANSTAIGFGSFSAENSAAVGTGANANSTNSLALGFGANASANTSVALGSGSIASGVNSIAIGTGANASAANSVAIGSGVVSNTAGHLNLGVSSNISNINIGLVGGNFSNQTIAIGSSNGNVYLNGTVYTPTGAVAQSSDIRKKNILGEYKSGLDDIMKIKTYNFTYKNNTKTKRVGVIAQELKKIFPNAVLTDDEGFLAIRMEDMFYAVINAVKELNNKVISLEKENKELKKQIEELSKRVYVLENKN